LLNSKDAKNKTGLQKNLDNLPPVKAERKAFKIWFRDGQTYFVKWKDTKVVCVISSHYPATRREMVERKKG